MKKQNKQNQAPSPSKYEQNFTNLRTTKVVFMFVFRTFVILSYFGGVAFSQNIAINTTGNTGNATAILDIEATNKGLLIPRMTLCQRTTPSCAGGLLDASGNFLSAVAAQGLLVYQTDGTQGFYYNTSITITPSWAYLSSGGGSGWLLLGNAGTVDGTNFIGTTDNIPFNIRVNNQKAGRVRYDGVLAGEVFLGYQAGNNNTAATSTGIGFQALYSNTSGIYNTAIGFQALSANTTGNYNTASGRNALQANLTGAYNTASGVAALYSNAIGNYNTASGYQALYSNAAGSNATAIGTNAMQYAYNTATAFTNYNVALGFEALRGSTTASANTGNYNTALGYQTLWSNTNGGSNTALGWSVLYSNTSGYQNNAMGVYALYLNSSGYRNTASGYQALYGNTIGWENTASGHQAMSTNTSGNYNTAAGMNTLYFNSTGSSNTALGHSAGYGATGVNFTQCTFVGSNSYPTVARTNVTMLGYGITNAECTGDNQVCIGNTAITQVRAPAAVTGFTAYSDARFKTNIKEDVAGLDFILRLKPVTYNVRPKELHKIWGTPGSLVNKLDFSDAEKETRIGFAAQDVEKAAKESGFNFPGIDVPKNTQEAYALRYVDFIMPLVKAVQEQQKEITNYKLQITSLQSAVGSLSKGHEGLLRRLLTEQTENQTLRQQLNIINYQLSIINSKLGTQAEK